MANESHLQSGFLNTLKKTEYRVFAETDYLLRTGTHIQNVPHQISSYLFLNKYEKELMVYYESLFQITLECAGNQHNSEKFYYLLPNQEGDNIGSMRSDRIKTMSDKHLLLGIYLFYLYKVELNFDRSILKEEFMDLLRADDRIKRLFKLAKQEKEWTDIELKTLEHWVKNALNEFEVLGLIRFMEPDRLEILPAIWRIGQMYDVFIRNIELIFKQKT